MWKTEAAWMAEALGGRYVHRSGGYVMSTGRAALMTKLIHAGFEASRRILAYRGPATFSQPHLPPLRLKEASKYCYP